MSCTLHFVSSWQVGTLSLCLAAVTFTVFALSYGLADARSSGQMMAEAFPSSSILPAPPSLLHDATLAIDFTIEPADSSLELWLTLRPSRPSYQGDEPRHPSLSTLHPSPSTLHPLPFALYPSPTTLHPSPFMFTLALIPTLTLPSPLRT